MLPNHIKSACFVYTVKVFCAAAMVAVSSIFIIAQKKDPAPPAANAALPEIQTWLKSALKEHGKLEGQKRLESLSALKIDQCRVSYRITSSVARGTFPSTTVVTNNTVGNPPSYERKDIPAPTPHQRVQMSKVPTDVLPRITTTASANNYTTVTLYLKNIDPGALVLSGSKFENFYTLSLKTRNGEMAIVSLSGKAQGSPLKDETRIMLRQNIAYDIRAAFSRSIKLCQTAK